MNNEEYLKQLAEAEKNKKRTELEQAKAAALTSIEQEKAKVLPTFTAAKQQASTQSQIGAKNLAEFWARRGQTRQGISAQAELSRQNVLGNTLGGIAQQEQAAITDYSNQALTAGQNYENNLANAFNTIDTSLQENLYNEKVRADKDAYNRQQDAIANRLAQQKFNYQQQQDLQQKSQVLKGVLIPHDYAVANQIKGVQLDNKTYRYQIGNDFVDVAKGISPFTGNMNKDAKIIDPITKKETWAVFSNGYQPNNVSGKPLKTTGVKTEVNGQEQNIYKTSSTTKSGGVFGIGEKTSTKDEYYFWDGANNKYWKLTDKEKKELGLK